MEKRKAELAKGTIDEITFDVLDLNWKILFMGMA